MVNKANGVIIKIYGVIISYVNNFLLIGTRAYDKIEVWGVDNEIEVFVNVELNQFIESHVCLFYPSKLSNFETFLKVVFILFLLNEFFDQLSMGYTYGQPIVSTISSNNITW